MIIIHCICTHMQLGNYYYFFLYNSGQEVLAIITAQTGIQSNRKIFYSHCTFSSDSIKKILFNWFSFVCTRTCSLYFFSVESADVWNYGASSFGLPGWLGCVQKHILVIYIFAKHITVIELTKNFTSTSRVFYQESNRWLVTLIIFIKLFIIVKR